MDELKIVITGPESSGKSWLCKQLAQHYKTTWAPEYARQFLETHGAAYDFETLEQIREEHLQHQQQFLAQQPALIFLDTDLINFQVWEDVVFGKLHDDLQQEIRQESDHRYLITYPDIPWEDDPLRENPHNRLDIYEAHLQLIQSLGRPYRVVKGMGLGRLENAISATEELLRQG